MKTILATTALMAVLSTASMATELKFANYASPNHTIVVSVMDKMNDDVSAATNGELTIRGYHGGELGAGPLEQYVRVVQGVADLAWSLPGYTSTQFPLTMIVELPDAIPLDEPGYKALWNAYDDYLRPEFAGTIPVALWTSEPNIFIMKDHDVHSPDDVKGLKLRVAGATAAEVVESFGATPVQMPIQEVYNALQTGLIDGVLTGASTLQDFKLDEVANSYTFGANLGRLAFYTVLNEQVYNGLPDDQKAAIDAASGIELSKSAEDAWNATAKAAVETAKKDPNNTFIDLTSEEVAAFATAAAGVTDKYIADHNGAGALAEMRGE